MIPCSSRVKCHAWDVPCMFHGILRMKVHVHTLRETWSMQTRDVNLEYLCRVSLRVHACKSEVINERYCITVPIKLLGSTNQNWLCAKLLPMAILIYPVVCVNSYCLLRTQHHCLLLNGREGSLSACPPTPATLLPPLTHSLPYKQDSSYYRSCKKSLKN